MPSNKSKVSVLHRVRRTANKLLSPAGIVVEKTHKKKWNWGRTMVPTQIGRYTIQVPINNPIATGYSRFPHFSRPLGRLASVVRKKYPALTVMDIGANVGDTVCILKSAEDVPIICIEGDDLAYSILTENLRQFKDATAHKLFLSEKTGTISATFDKVGWNTTIAPGDSASARWIEVTSLDDFIAIHPECNACNLLKIDTEGFDCAIIRGAVQFLRRACPVLTFEYNRENMDAIGEPGLDTLFMLEELGYSRIALHESSGRFLCAATLRDRQLLKDLHDFADGKNGAIYYYDITVFAKRDNDLAQAFEDVERANRTKVSEANAAAT